MKPRQPEVALDFARCQLRQHSQELFRLKDETECRTTFIRLPLFSTSRSGCYRIRSDFFAPLLGYCLTRWVGHMARGSMSNLTATEQRVPAQLATRLVHAGERMAGTGTQNGPCAIPTSTPIFATTTFLHGGATGLDSAFERAEQGGDEYVYSRYGNPTVVALETAMADIEVGRGAVATASGMAALYLAVLAAGTPVGSNEPQVRHILASQDLYGSTHGLLRRFFQSNNVGLSLFDVDDLKGFKKALDEHEPDVVLIESLSNPLLKLADIETIAELAHAADARLVVDATMTTPVLQQSLKLGADIVVHSATKYLSGHADAMGGILVARTGFMLDTARSYCRSLGSCLSPFEAKLISRGIKTLELRVKQQSANALAVAQWLEKHPVIARVFYPGLPSHPQHKFAALQWCRQFGGMLTFELAASPSRTLRESTFKVMDALKLILPATSLGDIYSVMTYPSISSHRDVKPEVLLAQGVTDGTLRLSVGIEGVEDIVADLEQALNSLV